MGASRVKGRLFDFRLVGAGICIALAGCGAKTDTMTDPVGMAPGAGTTALPMAGTTGQPAAGTTGQTGGGSGTGVPVAGTSGTAGTGSGTAGTGGGSDQPSAGAGGMPDEAGTGGGTAGSGGPDTSGFLADCKQGGAQWGTEEQSGPCKSGVTVYGVKTEFGPYGVRSDYNVGQGFETDGTDDSAFCNSIFIPSFGADPVGSADLMDTHDLDFALYTVFYPGIMPEGEKFPLITWGNGTCAMPEGYGPLLRYVASFGYIIIAANSRAVGSGTAMRKGLDFMLDENGRAESNFYQKIDADKIGAMGHSQGGMGTVAAASDARIKAVILWNGGTTASKPFLAVSGDRDLGGTPSGMANACNAAPRPAAWLWYHQVPAAVNGSTTGSTAPGHLTLMMESERVIEPAVAWWDMMLKGSTTAKAMFVGDTCTLCDPGAFPSMWSNEAPPSIEYGHNTMLQ